MAEANLELRRLSNKTTLHIKFRLTKEFKIRTWIAAQLLKLTALILGCGIEFEDPEYSDDPTAAMRESNGRA